MSDEQVTLAAVQFVLCTAIGWACLCRINLMTARTLRFYRAAYSVMFAVATGVGFAPVLLHEWPTRSSVLMAAGSCLLVMVGLRNWRGGKAPAYTQRAPIQREGS